MAEIRVEGRRHRLWPWVLGLLLLLLLVWALSTLSGRGGDVDVRDDGTRLGATPERPAPTATPQEPQEPPQQPEAEQRGEAERDRMRIMA